MSVPPVKPLPEERAILLGTVQVQVLDKSEPRERAQGLLAAHHYLGAVQAVGEQVHYAVSDAQGEWVAVLVFAAAALHLRARDTWIGWSDERRAAAACLGGEQRAFSAAARAHGAESRFRRAEPGTGAAQ